MRSLHDSNTLCRASMVKIKAAISYKCVYYNVGLKMFVGKKFSMVLSEPQGSCTSMNISITKMSSPTVYIYIYIYNIYIYTHKQVRPSAALASLRALRPARSVSLLIHACHCVALQGSYKFSACPPASWAPQWLLESGCCQGSGV